MDDLLENLRKSFADSYRVDAEMKGGGMSRLFMATDLALNRKVVIKILPPELTSNMKRRSPLTCSTRTSCRSSRRERKPACSTT